jgi:hypothetical protein
MNIKRSQTSSASKPIKTILITRIWGNDGWCYIPELNLRQKFFTSGADQLRLESQAYTGAIPFPEHSELLTYFLYSQSPLSWGEQGPWGYESFEQLDAIHHTNIQMTDQHFPLRIY